MLIQALNNAQALNLIKLNNNVNLHYSILIAIGKAYLDATFQPTICRTPTSARSLFPANF